MREIKFRGKSKKTGEWLIGDFISNRHIPYVAPHRVYEKALAEDFEIDPETLGQFTGLYDKNGKEIYEGDIMRYHSLSQCKTQVSLVEYSNGMFLPFNDALYDEHNSCAVIGNIHDNPELL